MLTIKRLLIKILNKLTLLDAATQRTQFWTTATASQTQSIAARNGLSFYPTPPTIDGYTCICAIGFTQNRGNTVYMTNTFNGLGVYLYNSALSAQSTTVTATFLYLKTVAQGGS